MSRYKSIEVSEYEQMLKEISFSNAINLEHFDLLIYGGGGQDKKFYKELETKTCCKVLWTGWPGPKWSSIFSFIPGQAALIKILDKNQFADLYYELAAHSVSSVIYVPKKLTEDICAEVKEKKWRSNFEKFVKQEPLSFTLTSEADEAIRQNGKATYFYEYYLGTKLNEELIEIIERKNEHTT